MSVCHRLGSLGCAFNSALTLALSASHNSATACTCGAYSFNWAIVPPSVHTGRGRGRTASGLTCGHSSTAAGVCTAGAEQHAVKDRASRNSVAGVSRCMG